MNKVLTFIACLFLASPTIAQTVGQPPTTSGGGSLTPGTTVIAGGTNTRVLFDDNGVLGEDAGNTYNKTTGQLSLTGKTVTTSNPILNLSQTWNAGGVPFTGIFENVTDTASAPGSLLMDLQVGSASKFSVTKAGSVAAVGSLTAGGITSNGVTAVSAGGNLFVGANDNTRVLAFGTTQDVQLARDAANTLALVNGANAQQENIYATSTSSNGNFQRLRLDSGKTTANMSTVAADNGGTGVAMGLQFGVALTTGGGVTPIANFATSGHLLWNTDNTYNIGAGSGSSPANIFAQNIQGGTMTVPKGGGLGSIVLGSPGSGILLVNTGAGNAPFIVWGNTASNTKSAVKSTGTSLQARLADDSAFTNIQGKLTTDTAYTVGAVTTTGFLTVYDSAGTAYKINACTGC